MEVTLRSNAPSRYLPSPKKAYETKIEDLHGHLKGKEKAEAKAASRDQLHQAIDRRLYTERQVLDRDADDENIDDFWTTLSTTIKKGILDYLALGEDENKLAKRERQPINQGGQNGSGL